MERPTAYAVARKAIERLQGPEIPYAREQCDGFIKACVRQCGGELDASGTNDIFRNRCGLTAAFSWRKPEGLAIGEMLFIREEVSAVTPPRYRQDGIGDVNHIGIYVGPIPGCAPEYCVIHSSRSRGRVAASTLRNAWNRRGRLDCLDYAGAGDAAMPESPAQAAPGPGQAVVVTRESAGVRLRKQPRVDARNVICEVPRGTALPILRRQAGWSRVPYGIHVGWIRDDLLDFGEG